MGSTKLSTMAVPGLLVGIVLMMVVPLPPVLLDLLLAGNISLSVLVVLAVIVRSTTR